MTFKPAVPGDFIVLSEGDFVSPAADEDPLDAINENANWLWSKFQPPLVNVVYTVDPSKDVASVFQIPILPSADGIAYTFRHKVRAEVFVPPAQPLWIIVEVWTGAAWTTIETTGFTIAATDGTVVTYTHADAIAAAASILRVTYNRNASSTYYPESLLVYPDPGAVTTGKKASGVWPFDDGLLTSAGAGLNVEHHNRPIRNAHALLTDRAQMVMAFVQEDATGSPRFSKGNAPIVNGEWARIGHAVATFPGQRDPQLEVRVLASVTGGAPAGLIMVRQVATGNAILLTAAGTVASGDLDLDLANPGTDNAHAVLELWITNTAGNATTLHAAVAFWRKGS